MKRIRQLLSGLLCMAVLLPVISCKKTEPAPEADSTAPPVTVGAYTERETGRDGAPVMITPAVYSIVYGIDSRDGSPAAYAMMKALNGKTGSYFQVNSDITESAHEILIGPTARKESPDPSAIPYLDYGWQSDGNRIAVWGGSAEALNRAVDRFLEKYCDAAGELRVPTGVSFTAAYGYPYSDIRTGAGSLLEREVEALPVYASDAQQLVRGIGMLTGKKLTVKTVTSAGDTGAVAVGLESTGEFRASYRVDAAGLSFRSNGETGETDALPAAIGAFLLQEFPAVTEPTVKTLPEGEQFFVPEIESMEYKGTDYIDALNRRFESRVKEIKESDSEYRVTGSGKIYYLSSSGNDANSGLSAENAWRTIGKLNAASVPAGSVVLFERGGVWNLAEEGNTTLIAKSGVTYSAYGTGAKPLLANYVDATAESDWTSVGNNIWVWSGSYTSARNSSAPENAALPGSYLTSLASDAQENDDVGNIIFTKRDGSVGWGVKITKYSKENRAVALGTVSTGFGNVTCEGGAFAGASDLPASLCFYHDPNASRLYLRCDEGNPAAVFGGVRLVLRGYLVGDDGVGKNIILDNLSLGYTGAHGIGVGWMTDFTVRSCTFEWIGGSIQTYTNRPYPVRFGNAIQNWAACDGFRVEKCYFNQVYDASVTTQNTVNNSYKECLVKDFSVTDCAFENHVYGIELWSRANEKQKADTEHFGVYGLSVTGNLFRRTGYGIGMTRHDAGVSAALWTSMARPGITAVIRDSVFTGNTVWDCSESAVGGLTVNMDSGYRCYGNEFLLTYNQKFAYFPSSFNPDTLTDWQSTYYPFTAEAIRKLTDNRLLGENTLCFTESKK